MSVGTRAKKYYHDFLCRSPISFLERSVWSLARTFLFCLDEYKPRQWWAAAVLEWDFSCMYSTVVVHTWRVKWACLFARSCRLFKRDVGLCVVGDLRRIRYHVPSDEEFNPEVFCFLFSFSFSFLFFSLLSHALLGFSCWSNNVGVVVAFFSGNKKGITSVAFQVQKRRPLLCTLYIYFLIFLCTLLLLLSYYCAR